MMLTTEWKFAKVFFGDGRVTISYQFAILLHPKIETLPSTRAVNTEIIGGYLHNFLM